MRIKKLTAGLLVCVLIAVSLSTVCFAAETGSQDSTETAVEAEIAGSADESTELERDTGEDSDSSQEKTVTIGTVTVSGSSYLNLRSGSGMRYDVIGHEIVGEDGDWYEVVVEARTGYVHKDYVDVSELASTDAERDSGTADGQTGTEEESTVSDALTPDGNLTLVDDYAEQDEDGSSKQFITVTTKNGNYFYLIIDRDGDGNENVHFLNLVDEADLLALIDEEDTQVTEAVETEDSEETEEEEPEDSGDEQDGETAGDSGANVLPMLILVIVLFGGGGFFLFTKWKGGQETRRPENPDPDADYLDEEDESVFDLPDNIDGDEEDESTLYDAEDDEPV